MIHTIFFCCVADVLFAINNYHGVYSFYKGWYKDEMAFCVGCLEIVDHHFGMHKES